MLVLPINYFRIYLYIFQCANQIFTYLLVEVRRVELLTSCLQGRRSSQTELYPHMQVSHLSNFNVPIKVH